MRLLYISAYYEPANVYGGPVRSTSELCEGLVGQGSLVTVFTTNANGKGRLAVPTSQEVDLNGVKVWYFPLSLGGFNFYAPEMSKAIHRDISQYDLVMINSMWGYPFHPAYSACQKTDKPYVVTLHGQLQPWAYRQGYLKKKAYFEIFLQRYLNKAAALHCTDPTEVESARRLGLKTPAIILPNSIDSGKFRALPPRGGMRARFGIPGDAHVLMFSGRLARIKRADIAVDALAHALSAGIQANLVIAGPDEENLVEELSKQAQRLGCEKHVFFTGLLHEEELLSAYADADLFIMPSEIQENFGMAALEAMAAGLPILVSEGIPVGRYAQQAGAGRVLPCKSEAFSTSVVELLRTPQELRQMGESGRDLARQKFDTTVVARDMLHQFTSIVESGLPVINNQSDYRYA